jgi:orotate phosphoribosyltransferase
MTFDPTTHPRLVELIKQLAIVHGRVTLSSGIEADYYVDLRRATLHHEAAPLIGQAMIDLLDLNGITDYEAVGGLTMGADPVATAIMHQAAARMGRQVEGPDVKGRKVIVVEDTSTTGGSPLTAAKALEEAGAIIVAVATVVDRDTGAQKVIEDAGYRYFSAVSLDDLGLR